MDPLTQALFSGQYGGTDLVSVLARERRKQMANNPYNRGAAAVRQTQVPQGLGFWENLLGTAGKEAIGGGLEHMGQRRVDENMAEQLQMAQRLQQNPEMLKQAIKDPKYSQMGFAVAQNQFAQQAKEQAELRKLRRTPPKLQTLKQGDKEYTFAVHPLSENFGLDKPIADAPRYQPKTEINVDARTLPAIDPFWKNVPADARKAIASTEALAGSMRDYAGKVMEMDPNVLAFQFKSAFSTTDEGKLRSQGLLIVKQIQKALEGARPSDYDQKIYNQIIHGDVTASREDVAKLAKQAANVIIKQQKAVVRGYGRMRADPQVMIDHLDSLIDESALPAQDFSKAPPGMSFEEFQKWEANQ